MKVARATSASITLHLYKGKEDNEATSATNITAFIWSGREIQQTIPVGEDINESIGLQQTRNILWMTPVQPILLHLYEANEENQATSADNINTFTWGQPGSQWN